MDPESISDTLSQMLAELSKPEPNLSQVSTLNTIAQVNVVGGSYASKEAKAEIFDAIRDHKKTY